MIELQSIEEQELSKLAGLAVNPQAQRLGYTNKEQYRLERDLSLAVIKGKSDILWLAERYATSYNSSSVPTVNQYKDYIISLLLLEFIHETQYYFNSSKLTKHAIKVWSVYDHKKIWPYIKDNLAVPKLYAWGPLSSLSFYTFYSPSRETYKEDTWLMQVGDCLQLFWLSLGQSFNVNDDVTIINNRLQVLLKTLGFTEDFLLLSKELFDITYEKTILNRRRRGQGGAELDRFKQRLIFNEYPQDIYQEALLLAPDKLREDFVNVDKKLSAIAKPGGLRLVLQAVIVETLYRSILLLSELDPLWKDQPLVRYNKPDAFLTFGAGEVRRKLLQHWIIYSDAKHLQYLFNEPFITYPGNRDVKLWKASVLNLDTNLSADYRLTALL